MVILLSVDDHNRSGHRLGQADHHVVFVQIDIGVNDHAIATGLDPDVCKRKIEELNQQKSVLEGDLKDREAGLRIAQAFENDLTLIRSLAHNFMNEFDKLPFERQRMLTLHFVERIDILDHSIARVLLRIPKLTPGKTLKPPMAKLTRKEIELKGNSTAGKNRKTPLDYFDQVGSNMLPDQASLDENNWFAAVHQVNLPIYLGNGFVVSPATAIGKVGLFGCPSRG